MLSVTGLLPTARLLSITRGRWLLATAPGRFVRTVRLFALARVLRRLVRHGSPLT